MKLKFTARHIIACYLDKPAIPCGFHSSYALCWWCQRHRDLSWSCDASVLISKGSAFRQEIFERL